MQQASGGEHTNDYVQSFAELGLVGLFFMGWLFVASMKTSIALVSKEMKGEQRYNLGMLLVRVFEEKEEGIRHLEEALNLGLSGTYAAEARESIGNSENK